MVLVFIGSIFILFGFVSLLFSGINYLKYLYNVRFGKDKDYTKFLTKFDKHYSNGL